MEAEATWREVYSKSKGKAFYVNTVTGEKTSKKPESGVITEAAKGDSSTAGSAKSSKSKKSKGEIGVSGETKEATEVVTWKEVYSKAKGKSYYVNSVTGEKTWEKPATDPSAAAGEEGIGGIGGTEGTGTSDAVSWNDFASIVTWKEVYSKVKGKTYYVNSVTGEKTWEKPSIDSSAAQPSSSTNRYRSTS